MRETVRAYEGRSGEAYTPSPRLLPRGRALRADEACPTLFRYPGPCGLAEWFGLDAATPSLARLGPAYSDDLWLSDRPLHEDAAGSRHFGVLAVLQPLRFSPVHAEVVAPVLAEDGEVMHPFLADNRLLNADPLVWVPPSRLRTDLPWDALRTVDEAADAVAVDPAERDAVVEELRRYRTELAGLLAAKAPGPGAPWCTIARDTRLEVLERHGVAALWSASH